MGLLPCLILITVLVHAERRAYVVIVLSKKCGVAAVHKFCRNLLLVIAASVLVISSASAAEPHGETIGNWYLSTERDRFSGEDIVRAVTEQNGKMMGVRCLDHILSLAINDPSRRFTPGDHFKIKFRADDNLVVDTDGEAISDTSILIRAKEPIPGELLTSKEFAFRVASTIGLYDLVFDAGSAAIALLGVIEACQSPERK